MIHFEKIKNRFDHKTILSGMEKMRQQVTKRSEI